MMRTLMISCFLCVVAQSVASATDVRTISVVGAAQLKVDPDSAEIDMAVTVVDMDVLTAKKQVDAAVSKLLEVTKKMQIAPEDITATEIRVTAQYDYNDSNKRTGYETTRSLTLTLRDLAKLDQLLNAGFEAGINQIDSITLKSSKERELKAKAVSAAIEDAKSQAKTIADEFGVKIANVQSIATDEGAVATNLSAPIEGLSAGGDYRPGKIKIDAGIAVVFQIK